MSEPVCCGIIEKLAKEYDLPFCRSIRFDCEKPALSLAPWSLQLRKLTEGGNLSTKSAPTIQMNFCPFCGQVLTEAGKAILEARLNSPFTLEQDLCPE